MGFIKLTYHLKKQDIDQENKVFLFPNQYVHIEFFRADTLGMGEEALAEYNSIIETFPGVFSKRIPSRTRSSFGVWTILIRFIQNNLNLYEKAKENIFYCFFRDTCVWHFTAIVL